MTESVWFNIRGMDFIVTYLESLEKVWICRGRLPMTKSHTDKSGPLFTRNGKSVMILIREWFEQSVAFRTLISKLRAALIELRKLGAMVINYKALTVNSMQDNNDFTWVGRD